MRRLILAAVLGGAAILPAGCGGEKKESKVPMDLKDVPADIMRIAKEKLPGVVFDSARKKSNGSIEVIGKEKSGKVREIDIRPDGSIEEIE